MQNFVLFERREHKTNMSQGGNRTHGKQTVNMVYLKPTVSDHINHKQFGYTSIKGHFSTLIKNPLLVESCRGSLLYVDLLT